jgi:hypothetical protein
MFMTRLQDHFEVDGTCYALLLCFLRTTMLEFLDLLMDLNKPHQAPSGQTETLRPLL